ncbi:MULTISPECIES: hypothetical protein [unclassified Pannonibacter]|uniref:hypothetical protein n=1 Tax=unclassified Pannonibacter TaxID=2627228 RepID=UPI001645D648|nr:MULTISPECIES: hypothetical protein [unclassified Pannonibacter]
MARYRVGNRYLSEAEYQKEQDEGRASTIFLIGAALTGIIVNMYAVNPEWHTSIRFLATVSPAIIAGWILSKFRMWVSLILRITFSILFLGVIISLIAALV